MRVTPLLLALLVLVAAVAVSDGFFITLMTRTIMIGVRAALKTAGKVGGKIGSVGGKVGKVVGKVGTSIISGGTVTKVTTAILTAADIGLNVANLVTNGCMYEKEICTLTPEIENLEKQIAPMYNQLTLLDERNTKMYNDLEKNYNKQNELAQQANKVQQLVLSIIQKIGDPVLLDNLAQEYEANTGSLMATFRSELELYQKSLESRAIMSTIADSTLLLYFGGKQAYSSLKAAGKISSPTAFKSVKFPSNLISFNKPPIVKKISTSLTSVKNFFKKPSVAGIAKKISSAGMVVGSMVGLGLTLATDITQARKMKDSLKNTRDEMKQILTDCRNEIRREQQIQRDLMVAFNEVRTNYKNLVMMINQSMKTKLHVSGGSTPAQLYNYQVQAINAFKKLNKELEGMNINFSIIEEVIVGVELNDDVSRIRQSLAGKNWGQFSDAQIYNIIAEQFPEMASYKGHHLVNYRG